LCPPPIHPGATLLPYTTLFRSWRLVRRCQLPSVEHARLHGLALDDLIVPDHGIAHRAPHHPHVLPQDAVGDRAVRHATPRLERRSEEHTSELQSPDQHVCRLLL